MGADPVELLGRDLVVEVNHAVAVARHILKEVGCLVAEYTMSVEFPRDLLVLAHALTEAFGQDMTPKIQKGLQRAAQVRLGGSAVVAIREEGLFVL